MKLGILFVALLVGFVPVAKAGSGWKGICQKDTDKFCQTLAKGADMDLFQCLQENTNGLAFECREELADGRRALDSAQSACDSDSTKFCATVTPGKGNLIRCLRAKGDAVTSFCRDALAKLTALGL